MKEFKYKDENGKLLVMAYTDKGKLNLEDNRIIEGTLKVLKSGRGKKVKLPIIYNLCKRDKNKEI